MENTIQQTGKLIARGEKWALFDFGRDAFGQLSLEIECKLPGYFAVAVGECLKDGRLDTAPGSSRIYCTQSLFYNWEKHFDLVFPEHITLNPGLPKSKPLMEGEILPFRYAEIQGDFTKLSVSRKACYGDFNDEASAFRCSDDRLNQVWEFCKYGIKATNCFEHYVDGNRERLPYEGDTYINQLGDFCCNDSFQKARRTIEHLLKFPTWPTEWRLMMPMVVRDYELYTGDRASVEQWISSLETCLLDQFEGEDLLLRPDGKVIRDIVDWPVAERDGYEFGSVNLVPNCFRIGAMEAMAELTGNPAWREKAEKVKQSIRKTFLKESRFVDSPESNHTALHSAIFPLVFNAGTLEECSGIRNAGMRCSVYAAQFFLEALFRNGLEQEAIGYLRNNGSRSWLGMIAQGSTITMEAWSNEAKPNQDWNHAWGAAPANLIPRFFCGIRPAAPGFRRFIIDPKPGDVASFTMRHPTIAGPVELEYERGKAKLTVPEGTAALFRDRELKAGVHTLR